MPDQNDSTDLARLDLLIEDLEVSHNQIGQAEPALKVVLDRLRSAAENPKKSDVLKTELETENELGLVRERLNRTMTALTHATELQRLFSKKRHHLDELAIIEAGGTIQLGAEFNRPRMGKRREHT